MDPQKPPSSPPNGPVNQLPPADDSKLGYIRRPARPDDFLGGRRSGFYPDHPFFTVEEVRLFPQAGQHRMVNTTTFRTVVNSADLSSDDFVFVLGDSDGENLYFAHFGAGPAITSQSPVWQEMALRMKPGAAIVFDTCHGAEMAAAVAATCNRTTFGSSDEVHTAANFSSIPNLYWVDGSGSDCTWYRFDPSDNKKQ